jgi:hypothetical protein
MHRNYRRKTHKHNPKKCGRGSSRGSRPWSLVEDRRIYWQEVRTKVRNQIANERYDEIEIRHRHSILWDWW